jgi:hypothetical protein
VQVIKKLRRVPWAENERSLVRLLLKVVKGRFSQIPLAACLASGLSKYHPTLGVAVADELLEQIRCGLEEPDAGACRTQAFLLKYSLLWHWKLEKHFSIGFMVLLSS